MPTFFFLFLLLLSLTPPSTSSSGSDDVSINDHRPRRRAAAIDVAGGPHSVVWAVQLSDLHLSVFHPERGRDLARLVGPALAFINPSLVLITGDLTDGKSKDLLTMKQEEAEWIEYQTVITDIIRRSKLDEKIFYDLKGNHDSFGVPEIGGSQDFYKKYSINSRVGRHGSVQSVTLKSSGWKYVFVSLDTTMEIGLRGPTNLFGHPTDQLLSELDTELSQWDAESPKSSVRKIAFGHFPLSFSAPSDSGKSLKDIFLKHSVSAYLCGHLHSRFGKNLKRHHTVSSGKYYQYNIHEEEPSHIVSEKCSRKAEPVREFWEWEMGDWRKSRAMRIIAIDSGHVSFLDTDFKFGSRDVIILPTFPLDSRFMQRISYSREYKCQTVDFSSYESIRTLVFSRKVIASVSVKIYDSMPGSLVLVLDSVMVKRSGNETRGDIYAAPWNWKAFVDSSPDRYWLQIEAVDMSGTTTFSQVRPFSINGVTSRVSWSWKEFYVMGVQWADMYHPILSIVLLAILSLLLIPQAVYMCSNNYYTDEKINPSCSAISTGKYIIDKVLWFLMELTRMRPVWTGIFVYLLYLMFFPWFSGYIFTETNEMASMSYKGWAVKNTYAGVPDVMVVVIPHLFFVLLPTILVMSAMAAERTVYRTHFHGLSGKKEDDHAKVVERHDKFARFFGVFCFSSWRWLRKVLILISMLVMWKHWRQCRALVKAYEMNPFLHSPMYCFFLPMLVIYVIFKTRKI